MAVVDARLIDLPLTEDLLDNYYLAYQWLMFGCCNERRLVCLDCFGTDIGMRLCGCDGTMTQVEAVEHIMAVMERHVAIMECR